MTTYDLDRMLGDWLDAAEPTSEPPALLPSVFATTRRLSQRRGLVGRVQVSLSSGGASVAWNARPLLTYAIVILLLLAMTFAVAFSAGLLRPAIPTGWRALDPNGAGQFTFVSDIAATESGFVAVGSDGLANDCSYDASEGRVWTSVDGDRWNAHAGAGVDAIQPQKLLVWKANVYLFGSDVRCVDPGEAVPTGGAWRSTDGATWEALPRSEVFQFGNVPAMAPMSDRLVAAGFFQAPPPSGEGDVIEEVRVWSTFDGANWEHIASMSGMHLVSLASRGDVLAALVYPNDRPGQVAILRSEDFGLTWQEQALPEGLPQSIIAIVAGPDRFVAVGDEVAISSVDGRQWSATPSDPSVLAGVNGIFTVPGGFLATRYGRVDGQESTECREVGGPYIPRPSHDGGSESVLTPPPTPRETICSTSPQGGGTAFSRDGVEWSVGPDLPSTTAGGLNGRYLLAGLGDGLVMSEMERGGSVWYSPLEPFLTSR